MLILTHTELYMSQVCHFDKVCQGKDVFMIDVMQTWQQLCLRWRAKQNEICTNFRVNTSVVPSLRDWRYWKGDQDEKCWQASQIIPFNSFKYVTSLVQFSLFFLQSCENFLCISCRRLYKLYQRTIFTQDDHHLSEWFRHLWSEWVTDNKITKWEMMYVKFEIALCSCGRFVYPVLYCVCVWSYCVCRRCGHPWRKGPFFHPPVGCSGLWNCAPWSPYGSSPAGR